MMRLRNDEGVQVVVTEDKAARLIAGATLPGKWEAAPDAEQPPKQTAKPKPAAQSKDKPATDIAAAIAQGAHIS